MGITTDIAKFAVSTSIEDLPANVLHEAKRDVINVIGCAVYSARDPSLRIILDVFAAEGGKPRASIWGTDRRVSLQQAALANGYTGHLEDYDDTHFPTVLHPSSPTVPAAYAVAEDLGLSGRQLLYATALGIELSCRVALAVHPWHYDEGWHITGTMGVFGPAIAAGLLLGLDQPKMVACLGIGGTQAAGVREVFGSMTKPFHAGRAAAAGLISAQLAAGGFTSTEQIFEGRRGVAAVLSAESDLSRITEGLGDRWEIFNNGLKPYACGVVNHPIIDACKALRARGVDAGAIESIEAEVHPLVPELVSIKDPKIGLEGKFSVYHCIAIGLRHGAAFPAQFSDAEAADPANTPIRHAVTLVKNESFEEDEAVVRLTLKDGTKLEERVEHATGAPQNPLTDAPLTEKFLELATPTLGESGAKALLDRLWRLDEAPNLSGVFANGA
ncbi:MAG: MmgE/PrpD family protein [Dehalococcoidia bacterium]|nr:MmgE/PrpD family protein [Dehalococcoidia bacterium]